MELYNRYTDNDGYCQSCKAASSEQQISSILTKIGNGDQLDENKITLIESRFCIVEEAEASMCPKGMRLFNTINSVNKYNDKILNAYMRTEKLQLQRNKKLSYVKHYMKCH
ncbi:hypothetical protein TNCV_2050921 [Trichonephila clavipes]|nr:hypothetical protein TNCV_2050921 [Trichonephila clavipes]